MRQIERFLHLPGNLVFAQHDAIETAGDAEQMPHRLGIRVFVEMRLNGLGANAVRFRQELGHERRVHRGPGLRPRQVKLDPIAGSQDRRFHAITGGQLRQRRAEAGLVESQLLAQFHRRGTDVAAYRAEVHGPSPARNGCDAIRAIKSKPKARIDTRANRRAGTLVPYRR